MDLRTEEPLASGLDRMAAVFAEGAVEGGMGGFVGVGWGTVRVALYDYNRGVW